ncbi:transporter [Pseudolysobacter antarcticus]|uniref:Transporter n=1 Tax=Pseudolysobacter antarcticus TaxID=2511995 RepID=A0A411HPC9_9GAMM|nr:transporter [Pseudolysobacter antarcticus]QBB72358.1 transporter [Pseudolysobacter antarcticus]
MTFFAQRIGVRLVLLLVASLAVDHAHAEDEPSATPYRPTISNPADLSAPGYIEFEGGLQRILAADDSRRDSVPYLFKYAFSDTSGILLGGDAHIAQTFPGGSSLNGLGDTFLEWKQRFPLSADTALGFEAGFQSPTSRNGLGYGKTNYLFNAILSTNFGTNHIDLNAGAVRIGDAIPGTSRIQQTWAASLSRPFNEQLGGAVELSGTHQTSAGSTSELLAAINYNASPRVVFDTGFAYQLNHAAHDRTFFAGVTWLIGKPF